jgi:hypothetical protein
MTFGCNLQYDGKVYHQGCPAAMAHIRAGYSIGQRGLLECSVCGGDLSECPHVRARSYGVRGGSSGDRKCRVCLQENCSTTMPPAAAWAITRPAGRGQPDQVAPPAAAGLLRRQAMKASTASGKVSSRLPNSMALSSAFCPAE